MNTVDAMLMEMWWSGAATAIFAIASILMGWGVVDRIRLLIIRRRAQNVLDAIENSDPDQGFTPPDIIDAFENDENGDPGKYVSCREPGCNMRSRTLPYVVEPTDEGTESANWTADSWLHEWREDHIAKHRAMWRRALMPF